MKRIFLFLALLLVFPVQAQTVWALTDNTGNVTGFYANAAPVPLPPNCCTTMDMSDARIVAYLQPPPSPVDLYNAAIAGGITITSTSTPSINGLYSTTTKAQLNLASIATSIGANQGLPDGASTMKWIDSNNIAHDMTAAQVLSLADAVRNYVYALYVTENILLSGGSATWPAPTATIP